MNKKGIKQLIKMLLFGVNTVKNRARCVKYMYRRCLNMYFTPTYSRYALNGASCSARPTGYRR